MNTGFHSDTGSLDKPARSGASPKHIQNKLKGLERCSVYLNSLPVNQH